MYYTNNIEITMKDNDSAQKALEILKNRLTDGFECDKSYKKGPSMLMYDNLMVEDNTIFLFDKIGCYTPEDSEDVMCELIEFLANNLPNETFSCKIWNNGDYTDSSINAEHESGVLKIRTVYYPSGYSALECQECGELICEMEEYEEGEFCIYDVICPECGEEIDMSDWLPIISEKTIKMI